MARRNGKTKKITKGMPSAVLLSIAIHAALFFLAGLLVVFTVVKKKEIEFEPPKAVERPKMKLKKPKPRIKKSSRPKKAQHILAKVNPVNMPEIQLPELSGMGGEGLGEGIVGGFDTMPDLETVSIYGSGRSIGNDLEGILYDFKRNRQGKPLSVAPGDDGMRRQIEKFIRSGWKTSTFARFYRSPNKLYSPTIMISTCLSHFAPLAFNERDMAAYDYLLHYKGQLVHPEGGRFRFWCMGDNFMVVRVDGRVVLDFYNLFAHCWDGKDSKRTNYHLGQWPAYAGQWMDLEPGVPLDMEVIFGEYGGGLTAAMLVIEEEGVDYPTNFEGGPMLPIFKTAELSRDQVDAIYEFLYEDHYSVTNGPVFCDYVVPKSEPVPEEKEAPAIPEPASRIPEPASALRQWTLSSGKVVEAELVMEFGDKVVLKTPRGRQVKVPLSEFSGEDLDYLELASPPPLKITFLKETDIFRFKDLPYVMRGPTMRELTAGVKIEKTNQKPYTKELKVELFSIADEIDGDNYILLDRQEGTFVPSEEPEERYELWGKKTYLRDYIDVPIAAAASNRRGERFKGHMVVVTDERGVIIAQSISNDWMLEIIDFLRTFPVGRHFSKAGERVYPPRAKVIRVLWNNR
ncbi:MAG: SHD1 domain-containing protein [Verrucomicrobiota bacterium]